MHNSFTLHNKISTQQVANNTRKGAGSKAPSAVVGGFLCINITPQARWKLRNAEKVRRDNDWNIDHKIPLASFDLTKPSEVKKACHYTNLQPMWAVDNRIKSNKV